MHEPGHARDLALQPVVEAVDLGGAALEHRVAEAADERHRGRAARLDLGIERRRGLLVLFLRLGCLHLGVVAHPDRVYKALPRSGSGYVRRTLRFCMVTTFFGAESFGGDAAYVDRLSRALLRARARGRGRALRATRSRWCAATSRRAPTSRRTGWRCTRSAAPGAPSRRCGPTRPAGPVRRPASCASCCDGGRFDVVHFHNISLIGGPGVIEMAPASALQVMTLHEHWLVCPTSLLWKFDREPCERRVCTACTIHARRPPQLWRRGGRIQRAVSGAGPCARAQPPHRPRRTTSGGSTCRSRCCPTTCRPTGTAGPRPPGPTPRRGRTWPRRGGSCARRASATLIDAMRSLPDVDLVLAGAGPAEAELRRAAAGLSNVRFAGAAGPGRPGAAARAARGRWWCRRCSSRPSATWWRRRPRWARPRSCTTAARRPS